ncbi:uncharacterized protein LOC133178097 [Saccostrea echinata]|uniref:uncharacterized protein LOC133178097 n=1 Tax=Saccostrea echinata TaxID=191078 RepID=UPI002A8277D4|nr:uncharacterized protein LOC133178097 [Saccostrea echinata]
MTFCNGRLIEEEHWLAQAKQESQINRQLRPQYGVGPCVIFILDTSASIQGQGFHELKDVFKTIIEEYSRHPDIDENVAVIVCGQTTKFQNYYTNQYHELIHCLDGVECEGLSPLAAGLLLSIGAIEGGASHTRVIHEFHLRARIVVMSDGRPTDMRMKGEIDDSELFETEITFLEALSARSNGGKVVYPHEARRFARYSTYVDQMLEIFRRRHTFISDILEIASDDDIDDEEHYQELDASMPPLGTRVKRGLTWIWKNQDAMGPGTVTGHSLLNAGWLYVCWDHGLTFNYRYGDRFSDVEVCDEPRILCGNEIIAPGCLVQRGPDWKWGNQDGGSGTVGMVYRVTNNSTIYVRWPNSVRSNYRFGYEGKYDVQLCDPYTDGKKSFRNRERRYQQGRGACNIFILDTSSNVGEEGFIQMKETFFTIMDEYAKHPGIDENVAVVICGKITAFKHYYSNRYSRLKHCIDDIEYGVPCPLTAAFILSEGGIVNGAGF